MPASARWRAASEPRSTTWASARDERVAIVTPNAARFLLALFGVSAFGPHPSCR
jgi:hypothetical protein